MKISIKGCRVWQRDYRFSAETDVAVENGKILSVGKKSSSGEVLNANGLFLLPGLVDVHTHGCGGYDFATATREQMLEMKERYARQGVTALFPTLASAPLEKWETAIEAIQECGFDGIHLEGRYLNPAKRGAHAPELLAPLDADELEALLRFIKIPCHITAAYELDKDGSFAATATRWGATMGLGHTMATAQEAKIALQHGVTSFSHLFNAMPPLHHREGGAVCVGLTSDSWVELIADGMHVSPDMIRMAYRCKSPDRFVLVTDSMEATGCPDGKYSIAGQPVTVKNGRAETADGALAGSTLKLWDGVKNLMRFADIPLEKAIACATLNPAEMVGIDRTVGSIEEGKRADLILVDDRLQIQAIIADGNVVLR